MSVTRNYLLPLTVIGVSTLIATPSTSAWLAGEAVKPYSPAEGNELKPSLWVNRSREDATLTIIDRFAPRGHVLVMDAANGGVIRDMSRSNDAFTLPALKQVGLLFVPSGKTMALTFRVQLGAEKVEFNLKKQYVSALLGAPLFNNRPGAFPPSSARINIYRSGFEAPEVNPFIECLN